MTKKYKWSLSPLKDFETPECCPTKRKARWVDKAISFESTQAQDYGKYFEYLVIGASAKGDDVTDLPRNANGSKKAIQLRLEKQAEWAKSLFDPESDNFIGLEIISSQLRLSNDSSTGILDILARTESYRAVIVELKCTADVTSTRSEFSWGNPSQRDYLQNIHYHNLFLDSKEDITSLFDLSLPPISEIIVVDYSPKLGRKHLELEFTDYSISEVKERFLEAEKIKERYEESNWEEAYDPSFVECENCPLKCEARFKLDDVEKEKLVI
jgi:hypothetical protein